MSLLEAVVLGVVQGLTEFLPISSTAHLRIVPALLGWQDPGAAYSAVIQLGTVAAVGVYFLKDLLQIARATFRGVVEGQLFATVESRLGVFVVLGTLPIGVLGLLFKKHIETSLRSLHVISTSLIVLALVMWGAERFAKHQRSLKDMTLNDAWGVGLFQALALIPGSSRSGTTLTGGLLLGLRREDAARFSFLLSVPATTLAGIFELKHLLEQQGSLDVRALCVGTGVSFVAGMGAIAGLLKFLKTRSTLVFIVYRLLLGGLLFALLSLGVLSPDAGL